MDSKFYRLISLLNYLGKISERIIIERLSHFAKTTNLLYNNQLGSRKQRFAINAAITLIVNIELKKHENKTTSIFIHGYKRCFSQY